MSKCRAFCFTINNYTDEVVEALHNYECKYLVFGKEIGVLGTPHLQGYVEHKDALTFTAFNKRLGMKKGGVYARCAKRLGTPKEAAGYCKKGEKESTEGYDEFFDEPADDWDGFEKGKISEQGTRTDIQEVIDDISAGKCTPDDICLNDAGFYHMYGRTCNKAYDILKRKLFRSWMTEGTWIYGPTGVGKSHEAFAGFAPDTHYIWSVKEKLQTYKGQETIIINDFRGELDYAYLLQLIDKWPMYIPYKGEEPFPLLAKKVIITSSLPPEKVYVNRVKEDKLDQLMRRIKVIELTERSGEQGSTSLAPPDSTQVA